jgi:hypothetical protein
MHKNIVRAVNTVKPTIWHSKYTRHHVFLHFITTKKTICFDLIYNFPLNLYESSLQVIFIFITLLTHSKILTFLGNFKFSAFTHSFFLQFFFDHSSSYYKIKTNIYQKSYLYIFFFASFCANR